MLREDELVQPLVAIQEDGVQETDSHNSLRSFYNVFKRISKLAIPMAFSFTFSLQVFLTVFLLNLLSETDEDRAAATLASVLMNTIVTLGMAPLFAVAIYLSAKLGDWKETEILLEKNEEPSETLQIFSSEENLISENSARANKKEVISSTNANSLIIATAATIPTFSVLYFSGNILTLCGQNEEVAFIAQSFLRTYAFATPALMARISFEQIMFSFGKTTPAMCLALASFLAGGSASGILGFYLKFGSMGVATGFVIESYLTASSYAFYVAFNKESRQFNFFNQMLRKINRNQLKDILKIGGSITFTIAIELATTLSVGILSGLIGTNEQSAMAFIMQIIYLESIALMSFSLSCAQELSRELGAKKYFNAHAVAKYGLLTTFLYLAPLPLIFAISPSILESLSGSAAENIYSILKPLTRIMSLGFITDIIGYNLRQQLRALRDLIIPNIITIVGLAGGMSISTYLGLKTQLEINGVAAGYAGGLGFTTLLLLVRWLHQIQPAKMQEVANAERSNSRICNKLCLFFKTNHRRSPTEYTRLLEPVTDSTINSSSSTSSSLLASGNNSSEGLFFNSRPQKTFFETVRSHCTIS